MDKAAPSTKSVPSQEVRHADLDVEAPSGSTQGEVIDTEDRRRFFSRAARIVIGACAAGAAAGSVRFAVPTVSEGPPKRFPFGRLSEFKMNTLTWLRTHDLFIKREPDGIGAVSARCTHLGCTVRRTSEGFMCPCHGAVFDAEGRPVSGPARRDLPWYPVWLEGDGRLWVDTTTALESGRLSPLLRPEDEES